MSKIDTLINLLNYQKQHPEANKTQTAQGIGVTLQYLGKCLVELNLLKEHLTPSLDMHQIRFLLSELDQGDPYKREICRQLQEYLDPSPYMGILRTAHPNEKPPLRGLTIGEFVRSTNGDSNYLSPAIRFALDRFCYDSLFWIHRNGEIEPRLATALEPVEDFSVWTITLRTDLRWSDGKPIIREDVIQTISNSRLASLIEDIKSDGTDQIHIRLTKAESMFPQRLASLPSRPSHSHQPYRVTSGAYRLKKFQHRAVNFRLVCNPDYYQEKRGGIDWITIRRFTHAARAAQAVLNGKADLIRLDTLQPLYQTSNELPLQQAPFWGEAYYLLFLNHRQELLKSENNCRRLKEAIDYRTINSHLHGGQHADKNTMKVLTHSPLDLKITCSGESPTISYLAHLVGKSVGDPTITPVFLEEDTPPNMREKADVLLSRIFFGTHYSRLSQYFQSQGKHNSFDYAHPEVDALLSLLKNTTDIAQRGVIGRRIMSLLQEDFAIILLSPYFQYLLSPLEIQFDATLTNHIDLIENMKHLVVERD